MATIMKTKMTALVDLYPLVTYSFIFKSGSESDGEMVFPSGVLKILKGETKTIEIKTANSVIVSKNDGVDIINKGQGQVIDILE